MTEEQIKKQFGKDFEKFLSGEISGNEFSEKTKSVLYDKVYDTELEIKESGLISAMELASELKEVEKGSEDFNRVVDPLKEYFNKNA